MVNTQMGGSEDVLMDPFSHRGEKKHKITLISPKMDEKLHILTKIGQWVWSSFSSIGLECDGVPDNPPFAIQCEGHVTCQGSSIWVWLEYNIIIIFEISCFGCKNELFNLVFENCL